MAQPNKQPKTLSSGTLTMKFMQRAAKSASSTPSTPTGPPSKRQRMSNGSYNSTPASTSRTDAQAVEEALAAEDRKRTEALEREAAEKGGESKWYLSFKEPQNRVTESALQVVSAGYSAIDAAGSANRRLSEEEGTETVRLSIPGRRSFGNFNKKVEKQNNPDKSSSDSDDSESESGDAEDEDDEDDPTGAKALIRQASREAGEKARAERKVKRKADKAEALRLAEERRKKQVKLNQLTSISGNTGGGPPSSKDIVCNKCGNKGHMQRDCPQKSRSRR